MSVRKEKMSKKEKEVKYIQHEAKMRKAFDEMLSKTEFQMDDYIADYLVTSMQIKMLMSALQKDKTATEKQKIVYEDIIQRLVSVEKGITLINTFEK